VGFCREVYLGSKRMEEGVQVLLRIARASFDDCDEAVMKFGAESRLDASLRTINACTWKRICRSDDSEFGGGWRVEGGGWRMADNG